MRDRKHRLDRKGVAADDARRLLGKKLPPSRLASPWGRAEIVTTEYPRDRRGGDLCSELLELALNALVAPACVLSGQAQSQLFDVTLDRRAAWRRLLEYRRHLQRHQLPVPAKQCLGVTKNEDHALRGSARLAAAKNSRSAGVKRGRATCRPTTSRRRSVPYSCPLLTGVGNSLARDGHEQIGQEASMAN
jgi:hypothetical protein